jgi:anthranilate synthase component 1
VIGVRDTTFEDFRRAAREGISLPVVREFTADTLTPVAAFAAIHRPPFGFLLESLVGGERWARYTFVGTEPAAAWRYRAGRADHWTRAGGWRAEELAPDPLAHIAARVRARRVADVPGLPRFLGGAVGYLGYDVVRAFERLGDGPPDDLGLPDAVFLLAETVLIVDNAFGRALVVTTVDAPAGGDAAVRSAYDAALERIADLLERLSTPPALAPLPLVAGPEPAAVSPCSDDRYRDGVRRLLEHIGAGDIFQAVLARRLDLPCAAPPLQVYRALRTLNPAPYLYHLALDDLAVVGSSPEVLVRLEEGAVTVRPIAGTRPRGRTPEEDADLAAALRADPKELAEHAMLVDLGRNDVGRVARFGSVRLTADRVLERYSHVQHLVSEIRGLVRPGLDAEHVLRACFPAGTVTGAPKIRAMTLLDELEPTRRGPYAGAVGYLGWGGSTMDTAIAIRTAILRAGLAHVQVGAGIVADSDPERELAETAHKASGVVAAIALAQSRAPRAADIFPPREEQP